MMAVRSLLQFLAYSCCPVDVHVLSSLAGLGWQLEQDQDRNWTGLPVQTPDTNYKLSDIRYQLLVNIPLLAPTCYQLPQFEHLGWSLPSTPAPVGGLVGRS